jgi:EmrB/QacA subfamily drug resistance transporter
MTRGGARSSSDRARWAAVVLACVAQFMVILDVSVVNVALPSIRDALGFSTTGLQWVVNAYTLAFAGFLLLGGRMADLLGQRRVFIGGLLLFSVASLVGGLADSQGTLVAARAAQGLGGAIISPASLAIITNTFSDGRDRNKALGAWGAMGGAGGAFGVLLGGVLTDLLSWQWILFINVPIGLAAIFLAPRFVAEVRDAGGARRFDVSGAVTITLGLVLIVFAIVRTEVNGWGSAQTIVVLAAGFALIGAFLLIEGRFAKRPLMPLRIFRSRLLSGANAVVFLLGCAMFAMWYFVSLYLQQVLGYSPLEAGLAFLPMTATIIVGSTVASRITGRFGVKPLLVGGMALQALGLLLFSGVSPDGGYASDVLVPSLLVAAGIGTAFVPITIAAVSGVRPGEAGLASGLVNTSRQMGGALGLAILATVATARTDALGGAEHGSAGAMHAALTGGFQRAFEVGAGFALVGALVALTVLQIERRPAAVRTGEGAALADGALDGPRT